MSASTPTTDLSPARLDGMRAAIHTFLSKSNVYDSLREIVDSYTVEHQGSLPPDSSTEIMSIIKEKGVLQELLKKMRSEGPSMQAGTAASFVPQDGEFYLHVHMSGGRAFVDNIDVPVSRAKTLRLRAALHFGSQRFVSHMIPCSVDPAFSEDFIFHLDAEEYGFAKREIIEVSAPVHIAVFREDTTTNTAELLGENMVDWRKTLKSGFMGLTVELCGSSPGVPSGILDMNFEVVPHGKVSYSEDTISERLERQRTTITVADREFLVYSRRWWSEYGAVRQANKDRKVKLFAATTNGRMVPVTHFISPLQAEFGLTSPLEAARFVSLMRFTNPDEGQSLGAPPSAGNTNTWVSAFQFLSERQGHPCNHATLLCSLLLGFGLDAYCCVGVNETGEVHVAVITRGQDRSVTMWNPTTGVRAPAATQSTVATVDCLFNHRSFFANNQASNAVVATSFDIENEDHWKPVNPLKLRTVPKYPAPPLLYQSVGCEDLERRLEGSLRTRLTAHRDDIGLVTFFDDKLSYTLAQALQSYERQRQTGLPEDLTMFEACVKGLLGSGKTFKAVPINTSHEDDATILSILRASSSGKEILETAAEDLKFGVRAKVFPFVEGVRSVWVLVAATYRVKVTG